MTIRNRIDNTSWYAKTIDAVKSGGAIMLLQALPNNALSRISAVACQRNFGGIAAAREIFSGRYDGKPRSLLHGTVGLDAYFGKETPRLFFKACGLNVALPALENHYAERDAMENRNKEGNPKAKLTFAAGLSLAEIPVNGFDTAGTMKRTGTWKPWLKAIPIHKEGTTLLGQLCRRIAHLQTGSSYNVLRAFSVWTGYSFCEGFANRGMKRFTNIDPHSNEGLCIKSVPQALPVAAAGYGFERIKNELQYRPWIRERASQNHTSVYLEAIRHIYATQGLRGFSRGFGPAYWRMVSLVAGSNYLLERGRRAQKQPEAGIKPSRH